ncbi:hypothetical protein CGC21_33950 [Leishmania donovani]|uniref:NTF2 domain-containing protein n=1 Tax=Leishmania donovani TaxID=5661 RepID=A0A504XJL8_LEIDO|nr:hypothetical protein CGC21_33950 [Leishmania donovani]
MSELQSLTPETAFTVASTFLAYYYSEFVKLNELARMSDLYDERSYMTLVDFRDEVPVVAHGRNAVANLLAKLDSTLGQRKVEIITVDTVALPHNCVQVICQGVMYLREYRRVFLHVFMLEPTAYRTKTYHIASDYLRFVDSEKEVIPEGAVVIAADQVAAYLEESRRRVEEEQRRQLLDLARLPRPRASHPIPKSSTSSSAPPAHRAMAAAPLVVSASLRKPREPRGEHKPREGQEKVAAASPSRPAGEGKKGGERGNRKPAAAANAAKGAADTAAATPAPAAERKPRRESGPTAAIIMFRVPKKIKLSDIKAELVSQGFSELKDLFWCGRDSAHAVAKFSAVEKATEVFEKKPFKIQGESLNLDYYHE